MSTNPWQHCRKRVLRRGVQNGYEIWMTTALEGLTSELGGAQSKRHTPSLVEVTEA